MNASDLVQVPNGEIDDTYIGLPLLVTVDGHTVAGGLSDIAYWTTPGEDCLAQVLFVGGHPMVLDADAVVLAQIPAALADS